MEQGTVDIERLLAQGQSIQIQPQGYSMYPMFVPGRDAAVIEPVEAARLKRGDVVLYRREGGILVLHRIWRIHADGFYMVGDNQSEVEGPLRASRIKGILTGFVRKGKYIPVGNPLYCLASRLWLFLRPVRPALSKVAAAVKALFFRKK